MYGVINHVTIIHGDKDNEQHIEFIVTQNNNSNGTRMEFKSKRLNSIIDKAWRSYKKYYRDTYGGTPRKFYLMIVSHGIVELYRNRYYHVKFDYNGNFLSNTI